MSAKLRVCVVSIGFAMVACPQYNLTALQTSIGVKDALGSTSIAVYEAICIVTLMIYVPVITLFGKKACLLFGQIPSLIFTIALLYPRFWTLTPAGVLLGIGESLIMPAIGAIIVSIPKLEESRNRQVSTESAVGIFVSVLGLVQAVFSIAPDLILKKEVSSNLINSSAIDLVKCGANDCPLDYAFTEDSNIFEQLVPTLFSIRIYLCLCCATQIIGILIQWWSVPSDTGNGTSITEELVNCKNSFTRLFRHSSTKLSLLTFPTLLQFGFVAGFIWSDMARAYGSCVLGVDHLGKVLCVTYITSFLVSSSVTALGNYIPRPFLLTLTLVLELSGYSLAAIWQPSIKSLYMPYILAVLMGSTHALRRVVAYCISGTYFVDRDSAYVMQTLGLAFGTMIIYILTNIVCVSIKLYMLSGLGVVSTVFAIWAHHIISQ